MIAYTLLWEVRLRDSMPRACALAILLIAALGAQEPRGRRAPQARGPEAAVAASGQDPAAVARGAKLFTTHCAGCHGATGRGGPGAPDLVRSIVVLDDEKGILIAPVIRNGRPDLGMPKSNLADPQISDVVAWLHVQTWSAGHRSNYEFQDVLTGNAGKGEVYFKQVCAGCHSPAGDLKGIGSRYDAFSLQARWLQPRGRSGRSRAAQAQASSPRSAVAVTVTTAEGKTVRGTLDRIDDFSVSLRDSAGEYHSFLREGGTPKVELGDPLRAHTELLRKYSDPDIHNVTAYLVSLK